MQAYSVLNRPCESLSTEPVPTSTQRQVHTCASPSPCVSNTKCIALCSAFIHNPVFAGIGFAVCQRHTPAASRASDGDAVYVLPALLRHKVAVRYRVALAFGECIELLVRRGDEVSCLRPGLPPPPDNAAPIIRRQELPNQPTCSRLAAPVLDPRLPHSLATPSRCRPSAVFATLSGTSHA